MGLNLIHIAQESKIILTQTEHISVVEKGKIGALDQIGREQLQHVDMLFRLYLPYYSLLK